MSGKVPSGSGLDLAFLDRCQQKLFPAKQIEVSLIRQNISLVERCTETGSLSLSLSLWRQRVRVRGQKLKHSHLSPAVNFQFLFISAAGEDLYRQSLQKLLRPLDPAEDPPRVSADPRASAASAPRRVAFCTLHETPDLRRIYELLA